MKIGIAIIWTLALLVALWIIGYEMFAAATFDRSLVQHATIFSVIAAVTIYAILSEEYP